MVNWGIDTDLLGVMVDLHVLVNLVGRNTRISHGFRLN